MLDGLTNDHFGSGGPAGGTSTGTDSTADFSVALEALGRRGGCTPPDESVATFFGRFFGGIVPWGLADRFVGMDFLDRRVDCFPSLKDISLAARKDDKRSND